MTRLTVLCFAGTYGLALLSELARFVGRWAGPGRVVSAVLIALGWLVQAAYLADLAARRHAPPLTSPFESLLLLGWVLAAVALYLEWRPAAAARPTVAGPAVLALALGVLVVAGVWAPRGGSPADWHNGLTFWGTAHGLFQTLGAVGTCLAFAFGVMYLGQARRLKRKRPAGRGLPLPSLEQSDRWHRAAIAAAFPLLTAGLLIGIALVAATRRAGGAAFGWLDPKVVSTVALWVAAGAVLAARSRPDWQGRRVMILTVLTFALLAFAMVGVGLVLPTGHGGLATLGRGTAPAGAGGGR